MSSDGEKRYLMDADALITPKNYHYAREICPAYWVWLLEQAHADIVTSVEMVATELARHEDWLAEWAQNEAREMFTSPTDEVREFRQKVIDHVMSLDKHSSEEVDKFAFGADSWLVAHALYLKSRQPPVVPYVVTYEASAPESAKIKIPDVCEQLQIGCITPEQMLQQEKVLFVLGERECQPCADI